MAQKIRAKTRRARLQPSAAAKEPVEETEETQALPTSRRASLSTASLESDEEHKDSDEENKASEGPMPSGDLFRGHKFYLTRSLRPERRAELRILITQNGGDVVAEMSGGAVEIVERAHLKEGEDWVAAEFVEDSIHDGALRNVVEYIAQPSVSNVAYRTPSGRPMKRFYTVEEKAKILQYLHDAHPKYVNKSSVPERIWNLAASEGIVDRTGASIHEHYRKHLLPLTRKERVAIFEQAGVKNPYEGGANAATSAEADQEEETERKAKREANKRARRAATEMARNASDAAHSDDEIQGRAKKRARNVNTREKRSALEETLSRHEEEEEEEEEEAEEEAEEEESKQREEYEEDEASHPRTPPLADVEEGGAESTEIALQQEQEPANADQKDEASGEVFRSYWKRVASDLSERKALERFFVPPPLPEFDTSRTMALSSAPASAQHTPQRARRLSQMSEPGGSISTPTPQKRRRGRRISTDLVATPGSLTPVQAAQQELLSQLEEMVGQRMTPPSRRKSLDRLIPVHEATGEEADAILSRLEFRTAQDRNTVCSALYWSSGDSDVARDFLLGRSPPEIWSPQDDQLLVDFMRADVTEADIANARHRGAFDAMETKRSARDILRRVQFLL